MTTNPQTHTDVVVSVLMCTPFPTWDDWRAVEDARRSILLHPRRLREDLLTAQEHFERTHLDHMTALGEQLIAEVIDGSSAESSTWQLCLRRWGELSYFCYPVGDLLSAADVVELFVEYPWFFYLVITDPAL